MRFAHFEMFASIPQNNVCDHVFESYPNLAERTGESRSGPLIDCQFLQVGLNIYIRTHARNLIFAILNAHASSFQSRSLIFAIFDNNIGLYGMCILTVRDVFDK